MRDSAGHVVGKERTTRTAFVPIRPEHEVVNDQLAAAVEQFGQAFLTFWRLEDVIFVDLHPREFASLGGESVSGVSSRFFFGEQLFACREPFFFRYDLAFWEIGRASCR